MVPQIEWRKRLLNHEKVEFIKSFQDLFIIDAVSAVGINLEGNIRKRFPCFLASTDIPAWLYLEFYSLVAFLEKRLNSLLKFRKGILDSDAYSCRNFCLFPSLKY